MTSLLVLDFPRIIQYRYIYSHTLLQQQTQTWLLQNFRFEFTIWQVYTAILITITKAVSLRGCALHTICNNGLLIRCTIGEHRFYPWCIANVRCCNERSWKHPLLPPYYLRNWCGDQKSIVFLFSITRIIITYKL